MKKILLIILSLLLIAGMVYAKGVYYYAGKTVTGGGDCPSGTYMFAYTGDYPDDTDMACADSGNEQKNGTVVDATVSTSYIEFSASDDYVSWVNDSADIISSSEGTIYCNLTIIDNDSDEDVGECAIWEYYSTSDNKMFCYVNTSVNKAYAYHVAQGDSQSVLASSTISLATTYRVGYTWKVSTGNHGVSCVSVGSSPSWKVENELTNSFTSEGNSFKVGELNAAKTVEDKVRVSDVYIFSTYQATDPLAE